MAARSGKRTSPRKSPTYCNWLEELDKTVERLPPGSNWLKNDELLFQRCRLFIMARYPQLLRPFPDEVVSGELSRGERLIRKSENADRVLRALDATQVSQLAGLLLDVDLATKAYNSHRTSALRVQKLAAEADRRTRMLAKKVAKVIRQLEDLRKYAAAIDPYLGLWHVRAARRCLKDLSQLPMNHSVGEYYRSLTPDYPALQDPSQLGMVELYWFFHHECRCTGRESQVRVAMVMNELLVCNLAYIPAGAEQGCPAVRQAVQRYRPRTTS